VARWIRIAAVAAVAAVATAPGSGAVAPHTCTTAQLNVSVARWFVGTGHTGGYIAFKNRSRTPCRLSGWPSLAGVTAAGAATVAQHVRSSWYGPYVKGVPVLTLRRGQVAEAAFSGSDIPPNGQPTCSPAFRHLRVTPPGTSRGLLLSAWFPPLGRYLPGCRGLEVSMVVRPSAFRH
jgi:Protein of unknown function (DUF4232)